MCYRYKIDDPPPKLAGGEIYVAVGWREAFGANRRRILVFRGKQNVLAEFVGTDNWCNTQLLAWSIKLPGSHRSAMSEEIIPSEFRDFDLGRLNEWVTGPSTRKGYAIRVAEDDHKAMVRVALIHEHHKTIRSSTHKVNDEVVLEASASSSSEELLNKLIEFGTQIGSAELVIELDPLVGNLIKDDPFAFLLASSVDRGMKAELAWRLPAKIKEALGHLDPAKIAGMKSDEMLDVLRRIDGKPRYLSAAARTLVEVARMVAEDHDGNARNLWSDQPVTIIKSRLERIYGVGPGIAAMVVILLDRLGEVTLGPEDYKEMDPKPDVHLKRVFARLGLSGRTPTETEVIETARRLHPAYPGVVGGPCWHIGRTWCHAEEPDCGGCPMSPLCPKLI